ncbi:hypothetical protein T492DRAFT_1042173 [Pavlovales sp. CCMP2436]|nr:hypothetical protein T492DRAFT_1042173 [Pavlovales sp. CCMP2436]
MLVAGSGWGGGSAGSAGGGPDEARDQLARAIAMLVANAHFLALSCGMGAAAAPGGAGVAASVVDGRAAAAAASAGAFDSLATLVRLSQCSTIGWELTAQLGPGGRGGEGARLPCDAGASPLMSSLLHDGDRGGEGLVDWSGPNGAEIGRARLLGQEISAEFWDLVESPAIPNPSSDADLVHWTRAMITDTVVLAGNTPASSAARGHGTKCP